MDLFGDTVQPATGAEVQIAKDQMEDLQEWRNRLWRSLALLTDIACTKPSRNKAGWIRESNARAAVRAGIQSVCMFLRVCLKQVEREMNTLALMQANSTCGGNMKSSQQATTNPTQLLEEWQVELNPSDAHIQLRCNTLALAREYTQRLFPKSYFRECPDGKTYIHFAKDETDDNEAQGIIQRIAVPNKWVMNRRLQDVGKQAA